MAEVAALNGTQNSSGSENEAASLPHPNQSHQKYKRRATGQSDSLDSSISCKPVVPLSASEMTATQTLSFVVLLLALAAAAPHASSQLSGPDVQELALKQEALTQQILNDVAEYLDPASRAKSMSPASAVREGWAHCEL
ncbi:hypothetical protein FHG87_013899 [Trinorchestia longiramus]|nr:hypothetical protein FHG87_013899 [Trinorchestia longiramus]